MIAVVRLPTALPVPTRQPRRASLPALLCLLPLLACAADPEIRCDLESSGIPHQMRLSPNGDAYQRSTFDYDNGYRFAAQWLASPATLTLCD